MRGVKGVIEARGDGRRCWRFGQKHDVEVDMITTTSQAGVLGNLRRKADACDAMFAELVANMSDAMRLDRTSKFIETLKVPTWLSTSK